MPMQITESERYYFLIDNTGLSSKQLFFIDNVLIYKGYGPKYLTIVLDNSEIQSLLEGLSIYDSYLFNIRYGRTFEIKPLLIKSLKLEYANRSDPFRQGVSLSIKEDSIFIESYQLKEINKVYREQRYPS